MNDRYQTPLAERYASKEMQYIFSPDKKSVIRALCQQGDAVHFLSRYEV